MSFVMHEMEYVSAIWNMVGPGRELLAMLYWNKAEPDQWVLTYRFRYYGRDRGDPFKDEDEKSWYTVKPIAEKNTEAAMRELVEAEMLPMLLARGFGGPWETIDVRGSVDEAVGKLRSQSWAHISTLATGSEGNAEEGRVEAVDVTKPQGSA